MARGKGSSNAVALLVLLALLAGGIGWNYQRNLAIQEQAAQTRPFSTLSDADLAVLLTATEAEAEKLGARYEAARSQRASTRVEGTRTSERLRDFERVQAHGRSVRALGQRTSELEASLAELRREQAVREGQGDELQVFLRLAFSF